MIAKLSGILDSIAQNTLILDVNGVGYLVHASARTLAQAGQTGDPLSLLIETIVREDAFNLYGFRDAAEQEWFRLLTSVQGVGAKAALAILSVSPPDQLGFAITAGDKTVLTRADGVGPKLALRILTELKDKATKIDLSPTPAKGKVAAQPDAPANIANIDNDAVSALINLGYGRSDAYQAVLQAKQKANDNDDLQTLIRLALKELSS
ncbi:MAG: Holliday junction branch migration protein RuvA [Rhodospirillales bacterium]|nr:Holliday junction branch migration protein RuvA [Rhodospirillales bacterium]